MPRGEALGSTASCERPLPEARAAPACHPQRALQSAALAARQVATRGLPGNTMPVSRPMAGEFVHLHVHSQYSMLDGAIRVERLVQAVKDDGMPAVALTDHGNMYGAMQLYKTCKGAGIKPILGCEVYFAPERKDAPKHPYHLVLLASGQEGYKNLVRIVSLGWVQGMTRGVPRGGPRDHLPEPQGHRGAHRLHGRLRGARGAAARHGRRSALARNAQGLLRARPPVRRAAGPRLPRAEAAQRHPVQARDRDRSRDGGLERLPLRSTGRRPGAARPHLHRSRAAPSTK